MPAGKRRTVLKEYLEAMRALWTEEEASYDGEFVSFGPSLGLPQAPQGRIPVIIGAGAGPKTFAWIAAHADGWMTTPTTSDVAANADKPAQGVGRGRARGPAGRADPGRQASRRVGLRGLDGCRAQRA
ncbi:LLM class flavin-dependent oxidoreductase [Nocardioides convexus]|uniref:LLM class flavin-dependent oxidoreductase n=1 Tax=Nocardioides convexus TaxID=2712224 RepID=UPI0024182FA7|nr:LLM class flavin-dependent oxidoreductase [Nocardioides convexus]